MSFLGSWKGGMGGGSRGFGGGAVPSPKINGVSPKSPPPDFGRHAGAAEGDQCIGGETGEDVQRH